MSSSYAAVAKKGNSGKYNGVNINHLHQLAMLKEQERFDVVLANINKKIEYLAPYVDAEKRKCPLLYKLPFDIRKIILKYVVEQTTIIVFLKGRYGEKPTPMPLPTIAQAGNRQLRLEALYVTIMRTTVEIHSGAANEKLQDWLSNVDFTKTNITNLKTGFEAVHSLRFPYFSRFPHTILGDKAPNNDIELMKKCTYLEDLTIDFVDEELLIWQTDYTEPKSIERLRREYRLDGMLELTNLKRLRLTVHMTSYVYREVGDVGNQYIDEVAKWFEGELKERGTKVTVAKAVPWY